MLAQRFARYASTRESRIITIEISIMMAPLNINSVMGVLPAVLAASSTAPVIYRERISAFSMLIITTIHKVESSTFLSIFLKNLAFAFIFSPCSKYFSKRLRRTIFSKYPEKLCLLEHLTSWPLPAAMESHPTRCMGRAGFLPAGGCFGLVPRF